MDAKYVWDLFSERLGNLSPAEEYELRDPDFVMDMPQSGERISGRDNMRVMQEAYPAPPTDFRMRRVVGSGDVWVVEATADWSGRTYHVAVIVEFSNGKIRRETRYYSEPFEAPEWRAQWVERIPPDEAAGDALTP